MSTPENPHGSSEPDPYDPTRRDGGQPEHGAPQAPQYGSQQPQYGQNQPQYGGAPQAPQYNGQGYGAPAQENPGKTMGIVGFILSFLGCLSIVGIILSVIALNKSKRAGHKNGLALAGIIIGVLVLIGTIVGGLLFWQGYQMVLEACEGVASGTTTTYEGAQVVCP